MDALLSVAIGIGLAAACGFRVFVPLLALGLAGHFGRVTLGHGFEWIGTTEAIVALSVATLVEIAAYKVPWLDHALDTLATPAALFAGVVSVAAVVTDLPPLLRWSLALIGGAGAAGLVQGATVLGRLKSAATTGGLGNPLVALLELIGAVTTSILAILAPFVALTLVILLCGGLSLWAGRLLFGRRNIR